MTDEEKRELALRIVQSLYDDLPEMRDPDTPLQGSDAVDILSILWPEITKVCT